MLRNKCRPTTFQTITTGDANGWCRKWPVRSIPHALITPKFPSGFRHDFFNFLIFLETEGSQRQNEYHKRENAPSLRGFRHEIVGDYVEK